MRNGRAEENFIQEKIALGQEEKPRESTNL